MIYKIIKRVVRHETALVEARNEDEASGPEGSELTIEVEMSDAEVITVRKATKEETNEYRKNFPK